MAKSSTIYRCSECGWTTVRWVGRCGECQAWGSVSETAAPSSQRPVAVTPASPINQVPFDTAQAIPTGLPELDRVLGTGLNPGAVVLLAGEPGVGKSTLLLSVAAHWARGGRRTLYVSAEESASQVRLRAERTHCVNEQLYLAAESDLGLILAQIEHTQPELLVLDSVQTVNVPGVDTSPGGVAQVKEVTNALVRVAKQRELPVVLIGHVTKEGTVAGPRTLEHLVDVVVTFEGEGHSALRLARATKNRYGPADEVGCFQLTEDGIVEVSDPSGLFASLRPDPSAGTCQTITMAGRRPLLTEIQALVAPSAAQAPRRISHGLDGGRIAMILAVLQRRAGITLHTKEVYTATVGGLRVSDPATDLAAAIAVASAASNRPVPARVIAVGEVGLSGELRKASGVARRVTEAARLGFDTAVVPADSHISVAGIAVIEVACVTEALSFLGLHGKNAHPSDEPRNLSIA